MTPWRTTWVSGASTRQVVVRDASQRYVPSSASTVSQIPWGHQGKVAKGTAAIQHHNSQT